MADDDIDNLEMELPEIDDPEDDELPQMSEDEADLSTKLNKQLKSISSNPGFNQQQEEVKQTVLDPKVMQPMYFTVAPPMADMMSGGMFGGPNRNSQQAPQQPKQLEIGEMTREQLCKLVHMGGESNSKYISPPSTKKWFILWPAYFEGTKQKGRRCAKIPSLSEPLSARVLEFACRLLKLDCLIEVSK